MAQSLPRRNEHVHHSTGDSFSFLLRDVDARLEILDLRAMNIPKNQSWDDICYGVDSRSKFMDRRRDHVDEKYNFLANGVKAHQRNVLCRGCSSCKSRWRPFIFNLPIRLWGIAADA